MCLKNQKKHILSEEHWSKKHAFQISIHTPHQYLSVLKQNQQQTTKPSVKCSPENSMNNIFPQCMWMFAFFKFRQLKITDETFLSDSFLQHKFHHLKSGWRRNICIHSFIFKKGINQLLVFCCQYSPHRRDCGKELHTCWLRSDFMTTNRLSAAVEGMTSVPRYLERRPFGFIHWTHWHQRDLMRALTFVPFSNNYAVREIFRPALTFSNLTVCSSVNGVCTG